MTTRAEKLALLSRLATLRADRAKATAAKSRAQATRIEAGIADLREQRQLIAAEPPVPGLAGARAAWLRQSDRQIAALTGRLARARAELDHRLDDARREEGRRQVLEKLGKR